MERRITRDRRCSTDWSGRGEVAGSTGADDHTAAREVVGVVGNFFDEFIRDRGPHAAVTIAMSNRTTGLAKVFPDLMRVGVVFRIGVIHVSRPISDRAVLLGVVDLALPVLRALWRIHRFGLGLGDGLFVHCVSHVTQSVMVMAYSGQFDAASRALPSSSLRTLPSPISIASP